MCNGRLTSQLRQTLLSNTERAFPPVCCCVGFGVSDVYTGIPLWTGETSCRSIYKALEFSAPNSSREALPLGAPGCLCSHLQWFTKCLIYVRYVNRDGNSNTTWLQKFFSSPFGFINTTFCFLWVKQNSDLGFVQEIVLDFLSSDAVQMFTDLLGSVWLFLIVETKMLLSFFPVL